MATTNKDDPAGKGPAGVTTPTTPTGKGPAGVTNVTAPTGKGTAGVEPSPDVKLAEENKRLRAQLEEAGIKPNPEPYEPSFAMSEGVRADLVEMRTRARRDGRDENATGPDGEPLYRVQDPATGKWFTLEDLPADQE